mmetsp:Transcript_4671/g.14115  ORF Transcript_4671/g.14115 Transcript_4671/m.14115 type:complete len:109 (+) Transcript_4671:316-642(+)
MFGALRHEACLDTETGSTAYSGRTQTGFEHLGFELSGRKFSRTAVSEDTCAGEMKDEPGGELESRCSVRGDTRHGCKKGLACAARGERLRRGRAGRWDISNELILHRL